MFSAFQKYEQKLQFNILHERINTHRPIGLHDFKSQRCLSHTQRVSVRNTKIAFKVKYQMSPTVLFIGLTTAHISTKLHQFLVSIFSVFVQRDITK